ELKALAIKQSRTLNFGIAAIFVVLLLVGLLLWRQNKLKNESRNKILEQKYLHDLELKHLEAEKLKELDHLKSRFFANISHEFRTPLTLVLGPVDKVLSRTKDNDDKEELSIAKKYAGKLQILINNLLTISKLESGKMKLFASELDIVKLVGTHIQSFESLAKQKNITLSFKAEEENIKAYIDQEKFEQVLNNLLSNAFKFTDKGGDVKVAVRSSQSAVDSGLTEDWKLKTEDLGGQWVSIEISDTGRGIPPEHINHIFDRFYQVGQEDNSYYEGTGIGLALTKELVELHRGTIKVESNPDGYRERKGSKFFLTLPLGKDHLTPEEIEVKKPQAIAQQEYFPTLADNQEEMVFDEEIVTETNHEQPILLIVEDNADMRAYIREYFENDYRIIEAVEGMDGLEKSTEHIPDIIISDVMMPRMDGNEFCSKVKSDERTSHIPVILLTARASSEDKIEGLETGADDFISKPFDGKELMVRVKNLIEQRKKIRAYLERKIQKSNITNHIDFKDSGITSMDEQFLQKVIETVRQHHNDPQFNTIELGKAVGLGKIQLNRKIKALTGETTVSFIRTYRLNRASELIKNKSATVAEIAYDVGFSSPSYFTECFRLHFGQLPSEFSGN
ncbi:MAG: response regulator, partial [Bacteroidales bacterium]|nr:response regulator [Bacteroidales bacterium]